jgi:hypothetical protein
MCPFAENTDARCNARLTLKHVSDAMEYCAGDHRQCPIYRELLNDANRRERDYLIAG